MLRSGQVLLICSLIAVYETLGVPAAATEGCGRENCQKTEAVCCQNQIHQGAGLSCCGGKAYNPAAATCCEEKHGSNVTANLTEGLSEMVSACCGLKAYSPHNQICCDSTIVNKSAPFAQCCGREAYDECKQLCCGPMDDRRVLMRNSSHHQCCKHEQFDTKTHCCCSTDTSLKICHKESNCCKKESATCGNKTYDKHTKLRCQFTVVDKAPSNAQCCGKEAYDKHTQLCCGPMDDRRVLSRKSIHHQCCGHQQFNTCSHCCCLTNGSLDIHPKHTKCCGEESATCGNKTYNKHTKLCCGPMGNRTVLKRESRHHQCCGHQQFDTKTHCCCLMNGALDIHPKHHRCCLEESGVQPQIFLKTPGPQPSCTEPETSICGSSCCNPNEFLCTLGQCDAAPAVDKSRTDANCCDGRVRKRQQDKSDGSPGHCRGGEVYQPHTEICCNGQRHPREKNVHCCGAQAYNFKDTNLKCCAGTLYNLTLLGHEALCCGSVLQKPEDVCCSHGDKKVRWTAKVGFRCCGHLYYNTSLWKCCAGKLSPRHQQNETIEEDRLQSLINLSKSDLCKELQVGTVESVSPLSTLFSSILKVHGEKGVVKVLPEPHILPHILETSAHCSSPTLIPGKTYFFKGSNIFTDPNHDSVHQSIHFIFFKCHRNFTAG